MTESRWIIPLSDVQGDDELVAAASAAIRSGWWSTGPRVAELEAGIAEFVGAPHALAVANGTAALHLGLLALGIGPGDEVITPSLTFVAAANAIRHTGAMPVFCDVNGPDDLNLDPADLAAAITERTKAIVVLHYGGTPCDMEAVLAIAGEHGIPVVEDAAHAIGARHDGRACGTIGAVGTFSFFSNKNLPIGEGGAVVARDDEVARRLRLLRSHGMTTMTWDRHRGHASSYDVVAVGFNYRLDEIRAAMALVQLERLPAAIVRRAGLAAHYVDLLDGVEGIRVPFASPRSGDESAHHLAVAVLPTDVDREDVRVAMVEAGIQTSVHYPPIHRFTAYADAAVRPLPQTDDVASRILTLPLFPGLSTEQVALVSQTLVESVRQARRPGIAQASPAAGRPSGR
jgi:dTDP-4-amino-4,6-dideoxygalactose transaminase